MHVYYKTYNTQFSALQIPISLFVLKINLPKHQLQSLLYLVVKHLGTTLWSDKRMYQHWVDSHCVCSFMHTCTFMQINEQLPGRQLNEAQVFSVEISNVTGSRFVKNHFYTTTIFISNANIVLCRNFSFPYKLMQL